MPTAAQLANLTPPWDSSTAAAASKLGLAALAAKRAANPQPPKPRAITPRLRPDRFQAGHLRHVRAILRQLRKRLLIQSETLVDPKPLEQLARSIAVLSEVERKLAGRPDPGHYQPKTPEATQPTRTRPLLSLPSPQA